MKVSAYDNVTGRPSVVGTRSMISTPHYLASAAGFAMLDRGGSAIDALIAANATLAVVLNHMAGLGGDLFAQVWHPKTGKVEALNGSGRAGEEATIELYRDRGGGGNIEPRGALAANTVPGAVHAWRMLHQRHGKLDWQELFAPAIRHAQGFPVSQKFRDYIGKYADMLGQFETAAGIFLPGGKPPQAGSILRQPDLANSLSLIAEQGAEVFYRGELAERILSGLREAGGILTENDFAAHASDWVEPLNTMYKGFEITELPPNTQGIATLMLLNLIELADLQKIGEGSADYYHLMAEAVKLTFADRDRWVTDPETLEVPYRHLLSKEYAIERFRMIDMERATPESHIDPGVDGGDTVYLCAVDSDGLCVSLIQSVYYEFGSAFIPPGTGILLQNRGSFFKLDPEHPNSLQPRKRTFHTIIPAMALKDGQPVLLFGTMGGEGQPQTQAAILTRMVDFGFNVQEAIEAPRWLYGKTWGEASRTFKLEGRIPDGIAVELERRGHDLQMMHNWSQKMGHAQAIWIDRENGTLHGGADPRGDGLAIGH